MADGFQPKFVDLVRNTTTTVGTGNFNLGAAALGFTSFTAALQVGDTFYYSAIGVDKRPSAKSDGAHCSPAERSAVTRSAGSRPTSPAAASPSR
jgi:hypothetical protein